MNKTSVLGLLLAVKKLLQVRGGCLLVDQRTKCCITKNNRTIYDCCETLAVKCTLLV